MSQDPAGPPFGGTETSPATSPGYPVPAVMRALPKAACAAACNNHQRTDDHEALRDALARLDAPTKARGATWAEIDTAAAVWTIPAERRKAKREHRVPLSTQALAVLEQARILNPESALVFPGQGGRGVMAGSALGRALKAVGSKSTVHGMRSTFRSWAQTARVDRDLAELSIAHVVGAQVEQAYARSDLLEQRRPVMQAWADAIT